MEWPTCEIVSGVGCYLASLIAHFNISDCKGLPVISSDHFLYEKVSQQIMP